MHLKNILNKIVYIKKKMFKLHHLLIDFDKMTLILQSEGLIGFCCNLDYKSIVIRSSATILLVIPKLRDNLISQHPLSTQRMPPAPAIPGFPFTLSFNNQLL